MDPMRIKFENVKLRLGSFVLDVKDLEVDGNVVGILGPNGSGKSSLLKLMDGLIKPTSGHIYLDGNDVSSLDPKRKANRISYLPQEIPAPFAFRAIDVVKLAGFSREENHEEALSCMEELHIGELANRNFNSLSGGEKRLIMLAGTMYQNSDIVLLDEPETYLDIRHRVILKRTIKNLSAHGKSVIIVQHDLDGIARLTDKTLLILNGQILHYGDTSTVMNEKNLSQVFSVRFSKDTDSTGGSFRAEEEY